MESLLTPAKDNPRERHLRWVQQTRRRKIAATLPRWMMPWTRVMCLWHIDLAMSRLTKRQLARVVWPWLKKEQPARRTPRGRQGVALVRG